jgi:uncharacterized protein YggE
VGQNRARSYSALFTRWSLVLVLAALAGGPQARARQVIVEGEGKAIPTLTLRGDAELQKPADQLRITIGAVTEDAEAARAVQENASRLEDIIDAIRDAGLGDKEYQTSRYRIQPVHSRPPQGQRSPDWRPRIVAYQVTNQLLIRTRQLDLAGPLIDAATKAGANSIDSIGFGLADPRAHRDEAIAAAAAHARHDAAVLARASGVRLVRLLSVSLDGAAPRPVAPVMRTMAMAEGAPSTPIAPGEVTVTAGATLVYEIAPDDRAPGP